METNVCKNCGREMNDSKGLCHNCQNKKIDKQRKIGTGILGAMSLIFGVLKYFSKSNGDES